MDELAFGSDVPIGIAIRSAIAYVAGPLEPFLSIMMIIGMVTVAYLFSKYVTITNLKKVWYWIKGWFKNQDDGTSINSG